jgi:hypothetical protein
MGHSTVMLSTAKHLDAQRERPFASLRVTLGGGSRRDTAVMLSAAKHLSAHPERPFAAAQGDKNEPSIGINRRKSPSPSVGAREDDVGLGGPSRSPVGGACFPFISLTARNRATLPSPRATMKVAPTDHPASCLSSWLRVMRIGLLSRSPGTHIINISLHLLVKRFESFNCLIFQLRVMPWMAKRSVS